VKTVSGCFDRSAANAVRRIVGRSRRAVVIGRSARHLMVGAATVIGRLAQDRASQEKADQK
jgi:hypothetical protein